MARIPMGKVLLRNVIRHTDAHNKIQEESEMWKLRDKEKQFSCPRQMPTMHINRGHMHCDRLEGESKDRLGSHKRSLGQDEREARYWTNKLYEFEANDPDRWGHSGFKELYPEEFQIEGEYGGKNKHRKKKKSKDGTETAKTKRSKKSSKKKKKKKEEKKRKRAGGSTEESDSLRGRRRRKRSKSQRGRKRERSRGKEDESSSEDSDEEGGGVHRGTESRLEPQKKKRRKNWKEANEESDSSDD